VDAPVDAPVEAPVDAPVEAPVDAPVEAAVDAPLVTPVECPPLSLWSLLLSVPLLSLSSALSCFLSPVVVVFESSDAFFSSADE
jgi:hypothetical protein